MAVRLFVGKTWRLRHAMMKYIYTETIKPMTYYTVVVWWNKPERSEP